MLDAPPDEVIRQVLDRSGYRQMLQGQQRRGGPGAPGQHRGTHHRGQAVRRRGLQPDHRRLPGEHHSGQRRGRLGRAAGLRLGDDAARGQGAGVPGGVHRGGGAGHPAARAQPGPKDEELEEERRLAFVGMTRAKEELYLTPRPDARVPRQHAVRRAEHVPGRTAAGRRSRRIDLSASAAGRQKVMDEWRGGSPVGGGRLGRCRRAADGEGCTHSHHAERRQRWLGGRCLCASSAVRSGTDYGPEWVRIDAAGQGALRVGRREDAGGGARQVDHSAEGIMTLFD